MKFAQGCLILSVLVTAGMVSALPAQLDWSQVPDILKVRDALVATRIVDRTISPPLTEEDGNTLSPRQEAESDAVASVVVAGAVGSAQNDAAEAVVGVATDAASSSAAEENAAGAVVAGAAAAAESSAAAKNAAGVVLAGAVEGASDSE